MYKATIDISLVQAVIRHIMVCFQCSVGSMYAIMNSFCLVWKNSCIETFHYKDKAEQKNKLLCTFCTLYTCYKTNQFKRYSLFIDVFGHHCGIKVITISIHVDGPWLDHMVHGIVLMCLDKPCVVYDCFTLVSYYYMLSIIHLYNVCYA